MVSEINQFAEVNKIQAEDKAEATPESKIIILPTRNCVGTTIFKQLNIYN